MVHTGHDGRTRFYGWRCGRWGHRIEPASTRGVAGGSRVCRVPMHVVAGNHHRPSRIAHACDRHGPGCPLRSKNFLDTRHVSQVRGFALRMSSPYGFKGNARTCRISRSASLFSRMASVPSCQFVQEAIGPPDFGVGADTMARSIGTKVDPVVVLSNQSAAEGKRPLGCGPGGGKWHERSLNTCQKLPLTASFDRSCPRDLTSHPGSLSGHSIAGKTHGLIRTCKRSPLPYNSLTFRVCVRPA